MLWQAEPETKVKTEDAEKGAVKSEKAPEKSEMALAVQSALKRKSTQELQKEAAEEEGGDDESEDESALQSRAELVRIKRENHARYMRFFLSFAEEYRGCKV